MGKSLAGFFAAACLSGCVIGNTDGYRDAAQLQKTADQALKTCGAGKVKSVSAGSFACVAAGEQN